MIDLGSLWDFEDPASSERRFREAAGTASDDDRLVLVTARAGGLDALLVDALHMLALVVPPAEQLPLLGQALEVCRSSTDPAARGWEASLLNNVGMTHADAGDFARALAVFEQALAARRVTGPDGEVRIARWMVAWSLRNLDRASEALAIQRDLKAELEAAGETDPYVDEELALLTGDDPAS